MVFTTDGVPLHGLTGGYGTERRVEFIIPHAERKAGVAHFYIEASCNELFGQNGMDPPDQNRFYKLNSADLVVPNMEAWRLKWDFDLLHQVVNDLPEDTPLHKRCQYVANEIMNVFKTGDLDSMAPCRKLAEEILGKDWEKDIQKDSERAEKQTGTLWAVGHWYVYCSTELIQSHRHCLALALLGDSAKVGTLLVDPARPDGPLPRAPLLRYSGATVQVARGTLPIPLYPPQGKGIGRCIPASRRDMGRDGLQHAIWRGVGATVPVWTALFREPFRRPQYSLCSARYM